MNGPVIIGGSAGSFRIISNLVRKLQPGFTFPLIICVHINRSAMHGFIPTLENYTSIPILEVKDHERIRYGNIYVAPAKHHLEFEESQKFVLTEDPPVNYSRPSIDKTFLSAAAVFGKNLTGILLTGANSDGAKGLKEIGLAGGTTIVQDPEDAELAIMPQAALSLFKPDLVMNAENIIDLICDLAATS